jgi:DNA invertase Pin-like site-specific DNA recombinase
LGVVIYAKFNCSKQREASIEDQLRTCTEWCTANGYRVVGTYSDFARSGRSDDRPEFQRMVDNAGEAEVAVVYMMDRFSRDPYDAPVYKKRLRDAGRRVVSATESMPDGLEAILLEKVYEGVAAIKSAHITQWVRRGMRGNALRCMYNGVRVYGYRFAEDGT